ncbi:DNA glycosylase AlkZ-like family protein [uncultured Vagococcus sp.]|uniref:DNA glycosylase AlkZ-like family protein n=1 Tax=uncultured Vagococcus sp. TaxID=189676 RepID=UPI0028D15605|nr:crosslink repair DNA glycosylase YcaQ family protein [uncultured Vagococcus sp.]
MIDSYYLTNQQARNLLLLRQGLLGAKQYQGKTGTLDYIREIGSLQFDPIDICGRTADVTLLSRVKSYRKSYLEELLYSDRQLIDYFDKNLGIFPIEDFQQFYYSKKKHQEQQRKVANIEMIRPLITSTIWEKQFVSANDFDMNQKVDWDWGQNKLSRAALEYLYHSGELLIHHKDKTRKFYTLPELVMSDPKLTRNQNPFPSQQAFYTWMVQRRISNVGFLWNKASDAWLGIGFKAADRQKSFDELLKQNALIELIIEGLTAPLYLLKKDQHFLETVLTTERFTPRLEFIAPLDALIWDRKLISALFDFDYKWEIYTPVEQRQFGHYVLPILYGNRFIGRIELKVNRQAQHLELANYWLEDKEKLTKTIENKTNAALKQMALFNDCLTWETLPSTN